MADDTKSIYLELTGDDISPTNVRMSTVFGVLGGLERAIEAVADEMGLEFDENEAIIIPSRFEESSLGICNELNQKAIEPVRHIDHACHTGELDTLPSKARSGLKDVQSTLGRRGVRLDITGESLGLHGVSLTEDTPHIEETVEEIETMTSHAVVYGVCMRVNRSRRDAAINLHDGQNCTLKDLTDQHLQKLMQKTGDDFDQVFRIEGRASWSLDDYRIREIEVSSIDSVERDADELFGALRDETGGAFDDVDPIGYVDKLRGK